jgi:hypothetical protein
VSDARLPAHLEVAALIRAAESAGGFGTVITKGERDAGVILVLTMERGTNLRLWERMPRIDGRRVFEATHAQDDDNKQEFQDYLTRRTSRDSDLWLIELDVPNAERLVAECGR